MSPNSENNNSKYIFLSLIILLFGIIVFILLGPAVGSVFSNINASLPSAYTPIPSTPVPAVSEDLKTVDRILNQALRASLAYNVPETMRLEETVIIQLLLNPSVSEEDLAKQVEESGAVTTGTIQITPLMKAELKAHDGQAFAIEPLHDTPEQPVSADETTRWQWQATAKKGGRQGLTLIVYRLVKYEDKDYWREVETYKADIFVKVTFQQRLKAFEWKWLGGILLTSLVIPLLLRWWDNRKRTTKSTKSLYKRPDTLMKNPRIPLALFIAILAVSTASVFIRLAQREAPSLVIAAVRLSLASLILALPALLRHRDEIRALTRREWLLAALSGLFLAVHFAAWITSLEYTTVAASVVLVSTGPLWVALLSPLFLKEIPTRWAWIGMTLALLGGIVVGLGGSCALSASRLSCPPLSELLAGSAFLGNFLALVGAWAVAAYLMIGRNLRAKISLVPYIFIVYGAAAVALLIVVKWQDLFLLGYTKYTYLWMLCLALIPQLIGHSTYNWALRYLPASLVSVTTLGEPIGSAILAFFILGEIPTPLTLLGGALILAGIYLSTLQPSPQPA